MALLQLIILVGNLIINPIDVRQCVHSSHAKTSAEIVLKLCVNVAHIYIQMSDC